MKWILTELWIVLNSRRWQAFYNAQHHYAESCTENVFKSAVPHPHLHGMGAAVSHVRKRLSALRFP